MVCKMLGLMAMREDTDNHNDGLQSFDVRYGSRDPSTSQDDATMDAAGMQTGFTGRTEMCFLERRFNNDDTGQNYGNDPHNCEMVMTSSASTTGDGAYVRSRSEQLRAEVHETGDPVANYNQCMVFAVTVRLHRDRKGWQAARCKLDCKDWQKRYCRTG